MPLLKKNTSTVSLKELNCIPGGQADASKHSRTCHSAGKIIRGAVTFNSRCQWRVTCPYPGWHIEQGTNEGTRLTDLMAGEDNFQKAMDAREILMLILPDPSASFWQSATIQLMGLYCIMRINGHHCCGFSCSIQMCNRYLPLLFEVLVSWPCTDQSYLGMN